MLRQQGCDAVSSRVWCCVSNGVMLRQHGCDAASARVWCYIRTGVMLRQYGVMLCQHGVMLYQDEWCDTAPSRVVLCQNADALEVYGLTKVCSPELSEPACADPRWLCWHCVDLYKYHSLWIIKKFVPYLGVMFSMCQKPAPLVLQISYILTSFYSYKMLLGWLARRLIQYSMKNKWFLLPCENFMDNTIYDRYHHIFS